MAAPVIIKRLIEEFERLKGGSVPGSFDEAQLRTGIVEPFWWAPGWNVRGSRGFLKEKRVHPRANIKHADYCFQLKSRPQFAVGAEDCRERLDDAGGKVDAGRRAVRPYAPATGLTSGETIIGTG